jgi:hypothetical protein
MSTLVNQLTDNANIAAAAQNTAIAIIKPENVIHAGVTGLHSIALGDASLHLVRTAFSRASANVLVCAFALSIIAMPFAYILQWKILYSKEVNSEMVREDDVWVVRTHMRDI